MSSSPYKVNFSKYTKKHYWREFERKYWIARDTTVRSIINILSRIQWKEDLISWLTCINKVWTITTYKYEFRIAWSNRSAKDAWNRLIAMYDSKTHTITIELIYHKTNVPKWKTETSRWKEHLMN